MADLGMAFLQPIIAQQENLRQEALAPVTLAHQSALAREASARAGKMEFETQGERTAAALMAQRLGGVGSSGEASPPSLSDIFLGQAQIYAASGLPFKATQALQGAGTMAFHEAEIKNQQAIQANRELTAKAGLAQKFANTLDGVTDQESWDRANQMFADTYGKESPYSKYPYDPELISSLKTNAMTAYQKAQIELRDSAEQRRKQDVDSKVAHRAVQEQVAAADLQLKKDREARLAKVGGKDVGSPSSSEVKAATRLLEAQPGLVSPTDLDTAAFDVASQAKALRKANPGLTSDEAIRQAIVTKRASGDFVPGDPGKKILGMTFGEGKPSYQVAEPLPASGKASDLVVGKNYKNGAGVVMTWTKGGWKPAGTAAPTKPLPAGGGRAAPNPAVSDDDEEDNDGLR